MQSRLAVTTEVGFSELTAVKVWTRKKFRSSVQQHGFS